MFGIEMRCTEFVLEELESLAAAWLNDRRRDVAAKTLARRITSMRALGRAYGVAILTDYSAPTPSQGVPHPLPGGEADLIRMMGAAKNDDERCLLAFTGLCGLRIGEALSIRVEDIDQHRMLLRVRGKGDKTRIVPISKLAWSYMVVCATKAWLDKQPTLLNWSDRYARVLITMIGRRAAITTAVASHDLRATFATVAYKYSGKDLRVVQELLGHARPEQTALYVGVTLDGMRKAAEFDWED